MKCPNCRAEISPDSKFCKTCATPIPSSDAREPSTKTFQTQVRELTTGSTFAGRYQVIEELGRGGMGRVYKVFDSEVKEKVALKLIKPGIAADRESVERFRNELKTARDISHKHICRISDLVRTEGTYFLT